MHLMSARRMPGNKTSNYSISLSQTDFDRKSQAFLGKLRANFVGTKFTLFDNGVNPERVKGLEVVRKELCHIEYASLTGEKPLWNERPPQVRDDRPGGGGRENRRVPIDLRVQRTTQAGLPRAPD